MHLKGVTEVKKLLIFLFGAAALCGCDPTTLEEDGSVKCEENTFYTGRGIVSKTKIEGHEYLLFKDEYGGGICHSASCPCTKETTEEK